MKGLNGILVSRGARMPACLRLLDRPLRLEALCRELLELAARFFKERERSSLRLVDLADEPLFQLQAGKLAEGVHSLAAQTHRLVGRGTQGGIKPTLLIACAPDRLLDGGERFPAGDHGRLTT
jgi:hypothetical protein